MNINNYGFVRVAAASPKLKVADCEYNIAQIKELIDEAVTQNVQLVVFPELAITGYTCGDLFFQSILQHKAWDALMELREFMKERKSLITVVGLPIVHKNNLYNVAAVVSAEGILGFVPKQEVSAHNELNEKRWFTSGRNVQDEYIKTAAGFCPFSPTLLFETPHAKFGIEIGEDLWAPSPPSSSLSIEGADIVLNLSASSEGVGKHTYRKSLVAQQSARGNIAYIYSSAGVGESTTDLVFSGSCLIAENGTILKSSKRFSLENELIVSDIDIAPLRNERLKVNRENSLSTMEYMTIHSYLEPIQYFEKMCRIFNAHPFIPSSLDQDENFADVFNIQTHGLAKRLLHTNSETITLGISGGLDSTLALLVAIQTFDLLGLPRKNIHAITMPGFGTTDRTHRNALSLIKSTQVTLKEISIVKAVTEHLKDIGHDIDVHDVTYENSQARERTQILMDYANKTGGMVLGTGSLSEIALGWATYNGDHMSMYAVNAGVPKTLIASLVRWIAYKQKDNKTKEVLLDIVDTPFSPELLPADEDGKTGQETEHFVGPYELHDFFIYRMLRHNDDPRRIYFIAQKAFENKYSSEEILTWLKVFYRRFFSQQFKRSCMPDSPKIGSINLSPRTNWHMPSDAMVTVWLNELENL